MTTNGRHEPREVLSDTLHGVLVSVLGTGVLITGPAGVGKSACALELVSRGHRLVADDVVEIESHADAVIGSAPERFAALMHVRGLGMFNVGELFGETAFQPRSEINVNVELCDAAFDLPDPFASGAHHADLLGIAIPKFTLPLSTGTGLAVLIETAARLANGTGVASEVLVAHDALVSRSAGSQRT